MILSGFYDTTGFHTRYSLRRLDPATGTVSWEYLSLEGDLTSAAVHPDGTIYAVQQDGAVASLLALNGDTGAPRGRLSLGSSDRQSATAPVVLQDGRVAVLTHRWQSADWESNYANAVTVLSEIDSETLAVTEHDVATTALSAADRAPLRRSDPKRLAPDGHGGLLLLTGDLGLVYRVSGDYALSNPLYLRPDPYYYNHPPLSPQLVVGRNIAYALIQNHPYASSQYYNWGPPTVVAFDLVTLTRLATIPQSENTELYLLHSVTASGGAMVTGPEWGNIQEAWPGLWANVEPAIGLTIDSPEGVDESESPYWGGNAQASFAPGSPCGFCTREYTPPAGHGPASATHRPSEITQGGLVRIKSFVYRPSNQPSSVKYGAENQKTWLEPMTPQALNVLLEYASGNQGAGWVDHVAVESGDGCDVAGGRLEHDGTAPVRNPVI